MSVGCKIIQGSVAIPSPMPTPITEITPTPASLSWIRVSDGTTYYNGELGGNWALSCNPSRILFGNQPSWILPDPNTYAFTCGG